MCLWAVPTGLRPFGISVTVVVSHVLGDVPSPPLLGALQGRLRDWRIRCVGGAAGLGLLLLPLLLRCGTPLTARPPSSLPSPPAAA